MVKTVEVRELKNNLSKYMRYVRKGEILVITCRGKDVAAIHPLSHPVPERSIPPGLLDMARRGLIRLAKRKNDASLYKKRRALLPPGSAARLLDEDRGGS